MVVKYLFVKMRRDLAHMWPQFLSVFLMAFLGVCVYSGIEGVWCGMQTETDAYFSETNLADAWVYGSGMTDDDIAQVRALAGVEEVSAGNSVQATSGTSDLAIECMDADGVSTPEVVSGAAYDPDASGIWLDSEFASVHGLGVGDSIELAVDGVSRTFEIDGLVLSPEYVYYTGDGSSLSTDHTQSGYGFIGTSDMEGICQEVSADELGASSVAPSQMSPTVLRIKAADGYDASGVEDGVQQILGSRYMGFADRDTPPGVSSIVTKTQQIRSLSIVFSALFFLLALLTIWTTMVRLVDTQRTQIGVMKALGFRDSEIRLHYALYGLVVSASGAVAGLVVGPRLLSPLMLAVQTSQFTLPAWPVSNTAASLGVACAVIASCTVATLVACRKDLSRMPAETMRGREVTKGCRHALLERVLPLWERLPFEWKWTLRDISRNRIRFVMGLAGALGCMMLLITAFGADTTLRGMPGYYYGEMWTCRAKATLASGATRADRDSVQALAGGCQWVQESSMEIDGLSGADGILTVVGAGDDLHLRDDDGDTVGLPDAGAVITDAVAEKLQVSVGGQIAFRVVGETGWHTVGVTGIAYAPFAQGVYMSEDAFEAAGGAFAPTALLLDSTDFDGELASASSVSDVQTAAEGLSSANQAMQSFALIFSILKAAAVLMGVVILYNLGMLGFTEQEREYATMRVLGFHQSEVRSSVLRENFLATAIGWVLGLPAGVWFLGVYMKAFSGSMTFSALPHVSPADFAISSALTLGCAFVVDLALSRKARAIDMVGALKSVE